LLQDWFGSWVAIVIQLVLQECQKQVTRFTVPQLLCKSGDMTLLGKGENKKTLPRNEKKNIEN